MESKNESNDGLTTPKMRNWFTTFYLWWGTIVNSLMTVAYFATMFTRKGLWTAYDPMYTRVLGFIFSGILVVGYISLLRWQKAGFFILIATYGVSILENLMSGGSSITAFLPVISMLILYGVLQLRKNGVSCWYQLD